MKISLFIVRKIIFSKQKSFSKFITQLSITAISMSLIVMVVAMSFINGFQSLIQSKAYSFWGHIKVEKFVDYSNTHTSSGDSIDKDLNHIKDVLSKITHIDFVAPFIQNYGVVISEYSMDGMIFKGYDKSYNTNHFKQFIEKGRWLNFDNKANQGYVNEIVLSKNNADKLKLNIGDYIIVNFIDKNKNQRRRKLKVVGLYKTGFDEYDLNFAFVDLKLIQKLNSNKTGSDIIDGFEVYVKDLKKIDEINNNIYDNIPHSWNSRTTREVIPGLFAWLDLLDVNKWVLIIILGIIAVINMIASIVTFVLERSKAIGILKTLGMSNFNIQKIFIYYSIYIFLKGALIGNIIGLFVCFIQHYFGVIRLKESLYFVKKAPIVVDPYQLIVLILASLLVCFVVLIFPSYFISKLKPIKSIKIID